MPSIQPPFLNAKCHIEYGTISPETIDPLALPSIPLRSYIEEPVRKFDQTQRVGHGAYQFWIRKGMGWEGPEVLPDRKLRAVYFLIAQNGRILYIGSSSDLRYRFIEPRPELKTQSGLCRRFEQALEIDPNTMLHWYEWPAVLDCSEYIAAKGIDGRLSWGYWNAMTLKKRRYGYKHMKDDFEPACIRRFKPILNVAHNRGGAFRHVHGELLRERAGVLRPTEEMTP